MSLVVLATISFLGVVGEPPAASEAELRLQAKAYDCIISNAAPVERSEPSLSEAASFLMEYICVSEISALRRYKTNSTLLASMQTPRNGATGWTLYPPNGAMTEGQKAIQDTIDQQRAMYKNAHLNPDTGEVVFSGAKPTDIAYSDFIAERDEGVLVPASIRAFAGRAVLDARQSRLAH